MKNNTLVYRMGELEKKVSALAGKVDYMRTNDLPHLRADMGSLKTRVTLATVFNVGAIILAAVILRLL